MRPCLFVPALVLTSLVFPALSAGAENYDSWPLLQPDFESTGGGGIRILDYDPVVSRGRCRTDFRAVEPNGATYLNEVEFEAVPTAGGILCTKGRWRAKDGSAEGTTPFQVFIRDGVKRGK